MLIVESEDRMSKDAMMKWLLVAGAMLLYGCGEPSPGDARADTVVFHRSNLGDPATLDPHRNEENNGSHILRDLFEGLVTETADGKLEPGVAQSWSVSSDGRTYVFMLRQDARWSNGDPVTALDFVAGLQRTVDPATASTYAGLIYPIVNAAQITQGMLAPSALGVRALDEHTLEIELTAPTPYFLQLLTHSATYPLHRASFALHGDDFARPGNLVSNGAYRLTEWVVNSHIRLDKNEYYSGAENVAIDTVYYHSIEDKEAELRRYRAGELDYTFEIPNSRYQWIKENLGDELHVAPYLSVYFYGFDTTEPPFDDVRLRQALSMAIDRRIITEQVNGIGEVPAYGLIPPGVVDYESQSYDWRDLSDSERIAEAQRLYRAAGFSDAEPLRTELRYNTSENHRRLAVAIASMWKSALGVEVDIVNQEWKVLLQERRDPAKWDILRYGWTGDYNDPFTFLEIFQSDHGQNFTGIKSARFDDILARASAELDPRERARLLAMGERTLLDEYPVIPIYFYVSKHLVKPYVKGFQSNILDHNMTRHYRIERH
jgi:oligopeptide transport system substrate-binding protein